MHFHAEFFWMPKFANIHLRQYRFFRRWVFSNFSCRFLNPNNFYNLNLNCSDILDLRNLQVQVQKAFCFKNWSDLSLFEWILLVISKILGLQSRSLEQSFLTLGQNNFGNKIPLITQYAIYFQINLCRWMGWQNDLQNSN